MCIPPGEDDGGRRMTSGETLLGCAAIAAMGLVDHHLR
jgi:hypothetical protein